MLEDSVSKFVQEIYGIMEDMPPCNEAEIYDDELEGDYYYEGAKDRSTTNTEVMTVPEQYDEMWQIEPEFKNFIACSMDYRNEKFYLQAEFMEHFKDDYPYIETATCQLPNSYESLSLTQLRGYFTWRAKVRSGQVERACLAYAYLYIYELLNHIGARSPEDAIEKLLSFWKEYRLFDDGMDRDLLNWMKDCYILYGKETSYLEFSKKMPVLDTLESTIASDIAASRFEGKLPYFSTISTYKIINGKLYQSENRNLLEACFPYVMRAVRVYLEQRDIDFMAFLLHKELVKKRKTFFDNAIYFENRLPRKKKIMHCSETEVYFLEKGEWYQKKWENVKGSSRNIIGFILKVMEGKIREVIGFRHKLRADAQKMKQDCYNGHPKSGLSSVQMYAILTEEDFQEAIQEAVLLYFAEQGTQQENNKKKPAISAPEQVRIDSDKFAAIRKTADKIQGKLLVEEAIANETEKARPNQPNLAEPVLSELEEEVSAMQCLVSSLLEHEKAVLQALLNNQNNRLDSISKAGNTMIEVLLEQINEKALNYIDDNLIETNAASAYIFEEYISELQEVI